jgi:hypothetical protein
VIGRFIKYCPVCSAWLHTCEQCGLDLQSPANSRIEIRVDDALPKKLTIQRSQTLVFVARAAAVAGNDVRLTVHSSDGVRKRLLSRIFTKPATRPGFEVPAVYLPDCPGKGKFTLSFIVMSPGNRPRTKSIQIIVR